MFVSPALPNLDLAAITQAAARHTGLRQNWKNRGTAPIGYIKGMAVMYAVLLRKLALGDPAATFMAEAVRRDADRDALARYAGEFASLGRRNDVSGPATLTNLFVLLLGLGMRESSGRYCEGRDASARNTSADTAEAGLFQMSWDASPSSPYIRQLFDQYRGGGESFLPIFAEGVAPKPADLQNFGTGTGADFQRLCKECPAFAVEVAAVAIRVNPLHWGPLKRKEAELRPEAYDMLRDVQALVESPGMPLIYNTTMAAAVPPLGTADGVIQQGVKVIQERLRRLNYPPGDIDGIMGTRTRAALLAFQADNGLPTTGTIDTATVTAFDTAPLRPLNPDRITIKPNELAELGSQVVQNADRTKLVAVLSAILGGAGVGNSVVTQSATTTAPSAATTGTLANADAAISQLPANTQDVIAKLITTLSQSGTPSKDTLAELSKQIAGLQNANVKGMISPDSVQPIKILYGILKQSGADLDANKPLKQLFDYALTLPSVRPPVQSLQTVFDLLPGVFHQGGVPQGIAEGVATVANSLLPGFGGALAMLALGLGARHFSNNAIQARVEDHANAGNRRL